MDKTKKRHITKALTWRIIATLTTTIVAWLISGDIKIGLTVGFWEFCIKMILYYLHERYWYNRDFRNKDKS